MDPEIHENGIIFSHEFGKQKVKGKGAEMDPKVNRKVRTKTSGKTSGETARKPATPSAHLGLGHPKELSTWVYK